MQGVPGREARCGSASRDDPSQGHSRSASLRAAETLESEETTARQRSW